MAEPIELYKLGNLRITTWPQEEEGHILHIGGSEYALMRGILRELAATKGSTDLIGKLDQVDPVILHAAKEHHFSPKDIKIALSQARVIELEQEVSFAYSQSR